MVNLRQIARMLQATREELLDQLNAVDRAIAALEGTGSGAVETDADRPQEAAAPAPSAVKATKVKPKRVLTDAHKQAIRAGRHKAREAKEVAAGRAREMPEEGFVPAISAKAGDPPRLVKRQTALIDA